MAAMFDLQAIIEKIDAETGCTCEEYPHITHDETILIPADQLPAAVDILLSHFGIFHLSTITAQERNLVDDVSAEKTDETEQDTLVDEWVIELIYHFWHLDQPGAGRGISLMTRLPNDQPEIKSVISQIPGADFYEREVAEMFGVIFIGRDETPRLLLPDEWDQGPPFIRSEVVDE